MTKRKHSKRLAHEHANRTGQKYVNARRAVLDGAGRLCAVCRAELKSRPIKEVVEFDDTDEMTDGQMADYLGAIEGGANESWPTENVGTEWFCPACESKTSRGASSAGTAFNWPSTIRMSVAAAEQLVESALRREPRLERHGINFYGHRGDPADPLTKALEDFRREEFARGLAEVALSAEWIAEQSLTGRYNRRHSIAEYARLVTVSRSLQDSSNVSVREGSFLAAALGLGLDVAGLQPKGTLALKFAEECIANCRNGIAQAVAAGKLVETGTISFHEVVDRRVFELAHEGFTAVVSGNDPYRGPYTRFALVPDDALDLMRQRGFRSFEDDEISDMIDESIGPIEDYSGPEHNE